MASSPIHGNIPGEFNIKKAREALESAPVSDDDVLENFRNAKAFIDSNCTDLNNSEEICVFITSDINEHFHFTKTSGYGKQLQSYFKTKVRESKEAKKDKARADRKEEKIKTKACEMEEKLNGVNISSEFDDLYEIGINEITGRVVATPYAAAIADKVIKDLHVVMHKNNVFCYRSGCYRNDKITVESEVTRILKGICKGVDSNAIARIHSNIMKIIETTNPCYEYPFNKHNNAIPVKNGVVVLDYKNKKAVLEEADPSKWKFNYCMQVTYNESADSSVIVDVLKQYTESDYMYLIQIITQAIMQAMGYGPYKKATILVGNPDCGKSTFMDIVERIIGEECKCKVPLDYMDAEHRFSTAAMEGKLMNIDDELGYFQMKGTEKFKQLTGGYSHSIERKGVDPYDIILTAVHLFATNNPAGFDNKIYMDEAFWKRWNYIEFKNVFEKNDEFKSTILTEGNISGLFNEIIKLIFKIKEKKDLVYVHDWTEVRDKWVQDGNILYRFVKENMVFGGRTAILKEDLMNALTMWASDKREDNESMPATIEKLGDMVQVVGGSRDSKRIFETDEKGNPNTESKQTHCFILNYTWKPLSPYKQYAKPEKGAIKIENGMAETLKTAIAKGKAANKEIKVDTTHGLQVDKLNTDYTNEIKRPPESEEDKIKREARVNEGKAERQKRAEKKNTKKLKELEESRAYLGVESL